MCLLDISSCTLGLDSMVTLLPITREICQSKVHFFNSGFVRQISGMVPHNVLSVRVFRHLGIRLRFVSGVQAARGRAKQGCHEKETWRGEKIIRVSMLYKWTNDKICRVTCKKIKILLCFEEYFIVNLPAIGILLCTFRYTAVSHVDSSTIEDAHVTSLKRFMI